jgi:UDP-2,3-diacylglucosamine pyrophosphatase LpxH
MVAPVRAVFADCHVGRRPGDEEPFLKALDTVHARGARAITLLGDTFHVFVAHPKFETPAIGRFLQKARELGALASRRQGNRDFPSCAALASRDAFRRCATRSSSEPEPASRAHGDLLNEKDLPYRFWRFASKNPVSRAAINFVPRAMANRIVWKIEARLYRSNFKHKKRLPVEMIRAFAQRRLRDGVDVILLGHFHKSWTETIDGGRVEILPAFVEERRWMEIAPDGSTSLVALPE